MNRWFVFFCVVIVSAYSAGANLLSNPGFETPEATLDFAGTDWTAGGSAGPGRQWWAARSGSISTNKGGFMPGWSAVPADGLVYQDVLVSTGTYTFSIWVRNEQGYEARTSEVRIAWYDMDTNLLKQTGSTVLNMLNDDQWHQLFVTGTCDSQDVSFARATYYANFDTNGVGDKASFFDDAEFYAGAHIPTAMANGGFEPQVPLEADDGWRPSKWHHVPEANKNGLVDWGARSGVRGVGVYGFDPLAEESNAVYVVQNLVVETGTYSFAVYIQREPDFYLSNAELRIEWYDKTFTNKVCADSVSALTVPNDYAWHEYVVSGSCSSTELYEVRAGVYVEWAVNTNVEGTVRGFKIDDARFLEGVYDGTSVVKSWSYHAALGSTPSVESVPGTNVGSFLQVDYAATTTTYYVIAPADGFALYPGEESVVGLRTVFQRPENGEFIEKVVDMTRVGLLTIDSGSPFHGGPAAGTQTQMLWCAQQEFPRGTNGLVYTTNRIEVFYAPFLQTTNDGQARSERLYLVKVDGECTNNVDQVFHTSPIDRDYSFVLNPPFFSQLMDPSFDDPDTIDFAGSPWFEIEAEGEDRVGREVWATRTGTRGGAFRSWDPGIGGIFQDVTALDTQMTVSIWLKRSLGANINFMDFKLEWFNMAGHMMFAETNNAIPPADERWHRICLTSTLPGGEALYVRPVLIVDFADGTLANHDAIFFEDAELYSGGFTSTQPFINGGFETGDTNGGLVGTYWDGVLSDWVSRDTWAPKSGTWGADFRGAATGNGSYEGTLSQGLNLSTGTYAFSVWIAAENAVLLTNAEMRIQWLDKNLADVQPDTVETLNIPLDNSWNQYAITGTCNSADLFEVRPILLGQWDDNGGLPFSAIKIDDVQFGPPGFGDSDGDGIPDAWEDIWCSGDCDPPTGATGDDDSFSWVEEYLLGYDPTVSNKPFEVEAVGLGSFRVTFGETIDSRVYSVDYSENLTQNEAGWNVLESAATGSNGVVTVTDTDDATNRSYRIRVHVP